MPIMIFFIKICRIKLRKEWQALTTEKILVALPRSKGIVPELIDFFVCERLCFF